MLGVLTQQWAPKAMVISFKLETDQDILLDKVSGHHFSCFSSGIIRHIVYGSE